MHTMRSVFVCVSVAIALVEGWSSFRHPNELVSANLVTNCKLSDRDYLLCWRRAVDRLRPHLIAGIPELKIPPLDPLFVQPFQLTRNVSTVAIYRIDVNSLYYTGAADFNILDFHVDPDALTLRLKVFVPRLDFAAAGFGTGKIYGVPFHGTGRAYGTFGNLVIDMLLTGGKFNRDGEFYVRWKIASTDVKYGDVHVEFKDVFDEVVSEAISHRVSQNVELFESHFTPVIGYAAESYITGAFNNLHARYPFRVLYPKI